MKKINSKENLNEYKVIGFINKRRRSNYKKKKIRSIDKKFVHLNFFSVEGHNTMNFYSLMLRRYM